MALVKKTIELDQEQINRIKSALNAKSEKEALNAVLGQFDTEIQLAEAKAGSWTGLVQGKSTGSSGGPCH